MSKHEIRYDKTCQNCGSFVEKNYCPECGQQNTDSRHPFYHLFTHFIFDFFHYDSSFWRTTRMLFLAPGKLSLAYMEGKRKSQVNPFSFYIFISFLTFFIPLFLSYPNENKDNTKNKTELANATTDSIVTINKEIAKAELDSILNDTPEKYKGITGTILKGLLENVKDKERGQKALEFFINNLPKVLFIYMPIFAFWMWLFHNKKKRYYFDSGIFTLHFFSVVLLSITFCILLDWGFTWLNWGGWRVLLWNLLLLYVTFYFFRANRVFYGQPRFISNIKGLILMTINTFFIFLVLLSYTIFIAYKIYFE